MLSFLSFQSNNTARGSNTEAPVWAVTSSVIAIIKIIMIDIVEIDRSFYLASMHFDAPIVLTP